MAARHKVGVSDTDNASGKEKKSGTKVGASGTDNASGKKKKSGKKVGVSDTDNASGKKEKSGKKKKSKREEKRNTDIKKRRRFLKEHLEIKNNFVAHRIRNATDATRDAAEARAKRLFVDLEKDLHPKGKETDSDPWFVLHIGPPKTATTTIQCGLEKNSLRLAKTDGYHFMGGGCGFERSEYIMPNGESTVLRSPLISDLNKPFFSREESTQFVIRAKKLLLHGRSVVLSSELFGSRLRSSGFVMKNMRNMLVDSAKGVGFNPKKIRIVLAYRHFVDWLPSFYYQNHLFRTKDQLWIGADPEMIRVPRFVDYADNYLSQWEKYQQMVTNGTKGRSRGLREAETASKDEEGDDDDAYDNEVVGDDVDGDDGGLLSLVKDRQSIHPSWWLYQLWSHYFPLPNQVQVYDMHSPMNMNRPEDDIVTNFVCNMLPTADQTCSRLMLLEDRKGKQRQNDQKYAQNGTKAHGRKFENIIHSDEGPEYDHPKLHAKASFMYHNRTEIKVGDASENAGEMAIRPSSDHHAVILIEKMLIEGDIQPFDYSKYDANFFAAHTGNFTSVAYTNELGSIHKGARKKSLIENAKRLLQEHDVRAPNENFFDCMSGDLERRFLHASETFMDLIYKHTELLTHAAEASSVTPSPESAGTNTIDAEKKLKAERFAQARAEHARLFEKNKAKGKYCDINLEKIKKNIPSLYKELASFSYKPKYTKFLHDLLPESMLSHFEALQQDQERWDKKSKASLEYYFKNEWDQATPREKEAIFALDV